MGVGDVQLDSVPCKERRWRAGVKERCYDNDCYWWGVVVVGETKQSRKWLRQVGRETRLKLIII